MSVTSVSAITSISRRAEPPCIQHNALNGAGRMFEPQSAFIRLGRWLKRYLVDVVPDEIAHCEFGCRREQCTLVEWETCINRVRIVSLPLAAEPADSIE
ncbi:MAG: hypothetical protein JST28_16555 [Acidobacteria bacterium]|nr:hypothetical protein [Acidobacteriota bacterium]